MTRQSGLLRNSFIVSFLLSLFLLSFSFSGFTQSGIKTDTLNPKNILVKYLGIEDDMMLISVVYKTSEESKMNMSIYNAQGEILFRDMYQGKKFDRKFKVPKEHGALNFVFAGKDYKAVRRFEVFTALNVTDQPAVTRVQE